MNKQINMSKYFYILDAGHGGMIDMRYQTKGKRSPIYNGKQIFEGVYNREIVKLVYEYLNQLNIDSTILVPEQQDISLKERVKRVNDIYKRHPNSILISFHLNAGGGTGFEVYTSKGETFSDKVATIFFEYWRQNTDFKMRKDTTDGDPDKEEDFYILKNTFCPVILVESLFMDNEKDFNYLFNNKKRIAELHINSIIHCENFL